MKLAALSAWVCFWREVLQQGSVELAAGKRAGQLLGIHAGQHCANATRDHRARQFGGWNLPERKQGLQASRLELRLTIGPHVLQEQVAECDRVDALTHGALADLCHSLPDD